MDLKSLGKSSHKGNFEVARLGIQSQLIEMDEETIYEFYEQWRFNKSNTILSLKITTCSQQRSNLWAHLAARSVHVMLARERRCALSRLNDAIKSKPINNKKANKIQACFYEKHFSTC